MELKQHPLSAAFPAMSADDFAALTADVKANGQREPIIVFEGMVLDGWHRYRACNDLGVKPQQFSFPADKDPVAFVLSQNLHRRHLTASQRASAVVACSEWQPPNMRKGRGEPSSPLAKTNAEMAKAAQVSDKTIKDAKAAHKAGLGDAVKAGALTVKEAAQVARGKPEKPPKTQVAKPPKRELPQAPASDPADDLAEAQHTITDLAKENEELRDRIAIEAMDSSEEEKTQAVETIRELRALVRTQEAEIAALKVSRDTYMRESAEARKDAIYWRKQAKKAGADA